MGCFRDFHPTTINLNLIGLGEDIPSPLWNYMLDYFLELFTTTAIQLVPWIPGVFGVYLIIDLVSGLLFKER